MFELRKRKIQTEDGIQERDIRIISISTMRLRNTVGIILNTLFLLQILQNKKHQIWKEC